MKAFVYYKYGAIDQLKLEEVEKPSPKGDEVLVKVMASCINDWDLGLLNGYPRVNRFINGLGKPRNKIIGCDIAGIVEEVGKNVTQFKVGDEVYGDVSECNFGAFAEYTCSKERNLGLKPKKLSFEEAASVPQAGILAFQGFQMNESLSEKSSVLINGAGGGVGTFGVQLAKELGVQVTCVDAAEKLEKLMELGASATIDYKSTNYTAVKEKYDLIIDNVAQSSIFSYARALKRGGIFAIIGGKMSVIVGVGLFGTWIFRPINKRMKIVSFLPRAKYLNELSKRFESGKLKTVIDSVYPFEQLPEAFKKYESKKFIGKIVLSMNT